MKTITKKYKVYEFKELGKKVKKHIINSKLLRILSTHYIYLNENIIYKNEILKNELNYIINDCKNYLYLKDGIVFDYKKVNNYARI